MMKFPMESDPLAEVVDLGGLALLGEDALIRAAVHHRGERGGLSRANNERYHQFIVWRALLPVWHATIERDDATDIILEREGVRHHIEMKNWRDPAERQVPHIQRDINKLASRETGYLLMTSINPRGMMAENFSWLMPRLRGLASEPPRAFRFDTEGETGEDLEFWIAGWRVMPAT